LIRAAARPSLAPRCPAQVRYSKTDRLEDPYQSRSSHRRVSWLRRWSG